MKKGSYRVYFKIPFTKLGIKIARLNWSVPNTFNTFLAGMIMNDLERRRYKRFVLGKSYGYKFKPLKYSLCPTYFSCWLFNIVRHADSLPKNWNKIDNKEYNPSYFTESTDKLDSYGLINNKLVEIDYGDFRIYYGTNLCLREVDYK